MTDAHRNELEEVRPMMIISRWTLLNLLRAYLACYLNQANRPSVAVPLVLLPHLLQAQDHLDVCAVQKKQRLIQSQKLLHTKKPNKRIWKQLLELVD